MLVQTGYQCYKGPRLGSEWNGPNVESSQVVSGVTGMLTALEQYDPQIYELIRQEEARQSSEALADKLGVSSATVRRRVRKLIQSGAVRIAALVDPAKANFPLVSVIAFDVAHETLESALQYLASRPEVTWVSTTTGRFDILALARFRSTEELSEFVQRRLAPMKGLRDSETFVCLEVKKGRYMPV